ncbi:phosphatase PAP2 family protein [soil metagenome]
MAPFSSRVLSDSTITAISMPDHVWTPLPALSALAPTSVDSSALEIPISGRWLIVGALLSLFAVMLLMWNAGLTLDLHSPMNAALLSVAFVACALRYTYRNPDTRAQRIMRDAAEYIGLFTMVVVMGALASYPVAAKTAGYVDATLERIDHIFRFDWVAWYDVTAAHRSLQILGSIAYASIYVTPIVLLCHFAMADRKAEARSFIASFWLAAIMTLMLFMAFPAAGPLAFLVHGPIPYMPTSALYQSELIPVLRDGVFREVSLGTLRGLVCAPSFHTTSAVLYMLTAWSAGSLRWPLIAVNCAMLLSIPVEGTHYLADMIGGTLVGIVAFTALKVLSRRLLMRTILDIS